MIEHEVIYNIETGDKPMNNMTPEQKTNEAHYIARINRARRHFADARGTYAAEDAAARLRRARTAFRNWQEATFPINPADAMRQRTADRAASRTSPRR